MTAPSTAAYEQGQERLRDAVLGACAGARGLADEVNRGLTAGLSLLASDPELAHLLAVWPERTDGEMWRRSGEWWRRYGTMLRDAAEREGASVPPFFVEPMLIAGIGFLVGRHVRAGESGRLLRLLPSTRWYLLSFYLSPDEVARYGTCADLAADGRPTR